MRRAIMGERVTVTDEPFDLPETGRRGYFEGEFSPVRDRSGEITGAVGIVRETTRRRAMEEQLLQAQKMEAVGQLTGGIAHDFNNLLTVVTGSLELIASRAPSDEHIARLTKAALRVAQRGARLTGELLAFSRQQTLRPEAVDLHALVRGFETMLKRAVGEAIELRISVEAALWPCRVDPAQFETALLNLVLNARDAMPEGGVIAIDIRNADLEESAEPTPGPRGGSYLRVAVKDTGHGMSADIARRVFEPFFTTKDVGKGSGLGLSMVYGFVKQSDGHIAIESAPGSGTTVVLYLPKGDGVGTAEDGGRRQDRLAGGWETILVAEDDPGVSAVIAAMLEDLGYAVTCARTGREVIDLLETRRDIDLLMTDVVMPGGMSGIELAREVRRRHSNLKVLLVSGYAERVLTAQQANREFPILAKPLHQAQLARMIRHLLDAAPSSPG